MTTEQEKLYSLIDEYNAIDETDNEKIITFIEGNLKFFLDFKTDDITDIEDICSILNEYSGTLAITEQYSKVESHKKRILEFVTSLKGKSNQYNTHYYDIELNYIITLIAQNKSLKLAISALNHLKESFPEEKEIIFFIKKAKLQLRNKVYKFSSICSLIIYAIAFISYELTDINQIRIIRSQSINIGLGIILIQYIDNFITKKSSS